MDRILHRVQGRSSVLRISANIPSTRDVEGRPELDYSSVVLHPSKRIQGFGCVLAGLDPRGEVHEMVERRTSMP
jgi:hypothetical protein